MIDAKSHKFFVKRAGLFRYEIWFKYCDGSADPVNGASQWRAVWGVRFWRKISAMRLCADMAREHNAGWWAAVTAYNVKVD